MRLGQRLGLGFPGGGEIAQTAYKGTKYYRNASGVFLKDFGHGDSNDDAQLYSGQALDFDGVDDYVDCGTAITPPGTGNFSVCVTFTKSSAMGYLCGHYYASAGHWVIRYDQANDRVHFICNDEDSVSYAASAVYLGAEAVNRLVYVKNGRDLYGFLNGILVTTANNFFKVGATLTNSHAFVIGSDYTGGSLNYDGQIGNVQRWNAAFTADDVAFDYANLHHMKPAYENPDSALTADNLKGWWPLIEGSGDTAYDWSGNGNHGTIELGTQGNTSYENAWGSADALDSPLVPQTALLEWGMGSSLLITDFTNDFWTKVRCTVGGSVTGPDSVVSTTCGLIASTDNDSHKFQTLYTAPKFVASSEYTGRVICKHGSTSWARYEIKCYDSSDSNIGALSVDVDTVNNVVGTTSVSGNLTIDNISVSSLGDWCLIEVKLSTDSTVIAHSYISIYSLDDDNDEYFAGDGTTVSMYFWIAQLWKSQSESSVVFSPTSPATNALTPIRSWETAGQFKQPLNWNGRSYADAGNGADVNPSTALIIECVLNIKETDDVYLFIEGKHLAFNLYAHVAGAGAAIRLYLYLDGGAHTLNDYIGITYGVSFHVVFVYDSTNRQLRTFKNGSEIAGSPVAAPTCTDYSIVNSTYNLLLSGRISDDYSLGQLPLLKMIIDDKAQAIIDDDLDAWVAKRYAKAQAKYGL